MQNHLQQLIAKTDHRKLFLGVEGVVASDVAETLTFVVDQESVTLGCHEVRVSVNITGHIEPRKNLIKESLDLVVRAVGLELGDPDRATGGDLTSVFNVLLEICGIGSVVVPSLSLARGMKGHRW